MEAEYLERMIEKRKKIYIRKKIITTVQDFTV
jgi:hypothetical protein